MTFTPPEEEFFVRFVAAIPEAEAERDQILNDARAGHYALAEPLNGDHRPPLDVPLYALTEFVSRMRDAVLAAQEGAAATWQRTNQFLEGEYGHDRSVDVLIDCVLMYFPGRNQPHQELRRGLGPKLTSAVDMELDYRADPAQDAFLTRLRQRFPDLEAYVEENTYGDHDALLANPFLADVVRHAVTLHLSPQATDHDRAQDIFDTVASEYGNDPRVDELIAVSFVEDLPDPDDPGVDIVRRLPPVLVPLQEALRDDLTPIRHATPNA